MYSFLAFFEIPTVDFQRAVSFYETIFQVELPVCTCETEKMAFFMEEGRAVGALSWTEDFRPSLDGVLISFRCQAIEPLLTQVISSGGRVIRPKTKIEAEGMGYFALFLDSEGNQIGLYADR